METRGNYILIGLFTILGIVGALAFFLAFARVELDRDMSYYDIRFESISGLSNASDVRFAGLPVGQVVNVELSPERDGTITVRIEVDALTPVREDSIATVESQGITGVGFVAISAGSDDAELRIPEPGDIGTIRAGRSVIQSLSEDGPALVSEALEAVQNIGELFAGDNGRRIEQIIINAEEASAAFAETLEDFSSVTGSVDEFVTQIDRFNSVLQTVAADFDTVLVTADVTLEAWGAVAGDVEAFLESGTAALDSADGTLGAAQGYIQSDLAAITDDLRNTIAQLQAELATLTTEATGMVETFNQTGGLANDRLTEFGETIAALDQLIANSNLAMASVGTAATDFGNLIVTDGFALIDETRAVMATTQEAVDAIRVAAIESLPGIIASVETAANEVVTATGEITTDLTGATGRIDGLIADARTALTQATETFANANVTLAAISAAMETGQDTLTAATDAFGSAEAAIEQEIGPLVARLSETLAGLDGAVAQVSDDLPGISDSLSAAATAAQEAFEDISGAVDASAPAIQEFATSGLGEYADFAREARQLTQTLDRLMRQIERDPGRFFQGSDAPEFRR